MNSAIAIPSAEEFLAETTSGLSSADPVAAGRELAKRVLARIKEYSQSTSAQAAAQLLLSIIKHLAAHKPEAEETSVILNTALQEAEVDSIHLEEMFTVVTRRPGPFLLSQLKMLEKKAGPTHPLTPRISQFWLGEVKKLTAGGHKYRALEQALHIAHNYGSRSLLKKNALEVIMEIADGVPEKEILSGTSANKSSFEIKSKPPAYTKTDLYSLVAHHAFLADLLELHERALEKCPERHASYQKIKRGRQETEEFPESEARRRLRRGAGWAFATAAVLAPVAQFILLPAYFNHQATMERIRAKQALFDRAMSRACEIWKGAVPARGDTTNIPAREYRGAEDAGVVYLGSNIKVTIGGGRREYAPQCNPIKPEP